MTKTIEPITQPAEKELVITRILDAPRALVFKAWTDPKHLARWWGPKGFTNPVCKIEVHPGGSIYIDMKGPDGTVFPMFGAYLEIMEPEKLVFTSGALDEKGRKIFEILNTVTFTEANGKTTLTIKARVIAKTTEADKYLVGMEEGWTLSLERLVELTNRNKNLPLIVERTYNASVLKVWNALTVLEEMQKWYFDLKEFKPEIGFEFDLDKIKDGKHYLHRFKVTEVVPGKKIAYTWRYEGMEGDSVVTFELFPDGDKTRLKLTHTGIETFSIDNPDLGVGNFMHGWGHILGTSLKDYLEKE